jgi:RND family efflux transporter MFP subunit
MSKTTNAVAMLALVAIAVGAGYWVGRTRQAPPAASPTTPVAAGKAVLYYRNPMGLPDTSLVPKKDPMGMDYIPVYAGEEPGAADSGIRVSPERVQKLGVRTEVVARRSLDRIVRASGRVEVDERRTFAVAPKFEGWVERLHVNATGQPVGRGQPLFEAYSPELVSAQREYAIAAKGMAGASAETQSAMHQLAEAALVRLRNWDISDEQLKALAAGGEPRRTLAFRSPVAGVVTEKKAVQGMRFMPGDTLFQVADLSSVWVVADVAEQDIARVKAGARARLRVDAYPDRSFEANIAYIYPTLNAQTRTISVRLELANPGGLLKPAMYAQVELPAAERREVPVVPLSAVIDSGTRQVALVETGEGRFEPRQLKLGARDETHVEVIEGVKAGERVVVAGNFLIDSESNLKAALAGLGGMEKPKDTAVGHHAEGMLDSVDATAGTVTIKHKPVASLKWPAMTMDFVPANAALFADIKPGAAISFEFVERKPGEWVITKVERKGN